MASGTVNLATEYSEYYGEFKYRVLWETTQNKSAKTTNLKLTYQVYPVYSAPYTIEWQYQVYCCVDDYEYVNAEHGRAIYDVATSSKIQLTANTWCNIRTVNFTIKHDSNGRAPKLDDGTVISIYQVAVNGLVSSSIGGYVEYVNCPFTITDIIEPATITVANNFNDEENPTITYKNPMGSYVSALQVCIADSTGNTIFVPYRDVSKTGTSYTFNLTDAERKTLRKATAKNSLAVKFYIKTTVNGGEHRTSVAKTMSLINYMPTIAPTISDIGVDTKGLTGGGFKFIKGHNNMSYRVNATPQKEATIVKYLVTCGAASSTTYGGNLLNVESNTFVFTATDSRGYSVSKTLTLEMIDYIPLTCHQTVRLIKEEDNETDAQVLLIIEGNYFNQSFGVKNNELKLEVRHTQNDGVMGDWVNLTPLLPTVEGNKYSLTTNIDGFDVSGTYTFQCRATDSIMSADTGEYSVTFMPIFDWGATDFNFNVPVIIEGAPLLDYVIEQGTASMGSNGTWYWSKWKSGKAECYGCRNFGNMAISTAWGSMFMSESFNQTLPSGLFIASPDYIGMTTNYGGFIIGSSSTPTSESNTGGFRVARGVSETASQVYIRFNIIGRWK